MSGLTHTSALTEPLIRSGVSPEASDYAVAALDQFHDFPTRVSGLPDEAKGKSIVYDLNQQQSITASLLNFASAEERWDCHVAFIPVLGTGVPYTNSPTTNGVPAVFRVNDPTVAAYGQYNFNVGSPQSNDGWNPQGLLVVCKVNSESSTFSTANMSTSPGATDAPLYEFFIVEQLIGHTRARLISGGYEVHNVTEELYKGGTVTDYSVDDAPARGNIALSNGITFDLNNSVHIAAPPSNLTKATQINGVTREAAEGSYVNFKIQKADGFNASFPEGGVVAYDSDEVYVPEADATTAFCTGGNAATSPVSAALSFRRICNFQQCGSYYTGLSQQTVLNIQLKCQVEVFPLPGSPEMALASESPSHDPRALEFVHAVQNGLPVAHRVADNGLGDMFRDILKTANTVSTALAAVPGPIGNIAGAVSMGTGLANDIFYNEERDQPTQRQVRRLEKDVRYDVARQPGRRDNRKARASQRSKNARRKAKRRNRQMDNIIRKDVRDGSRV